MLYDPTRLPKPLLVSTAARRRMLRRVVRRGRAQSPVNSTAVHTTSVAKLPVAATLVAPHAIATRGTGQTLRYSNIGGALTYVGAYHLPTMTADQLAFGLTCYTHSIALHRLHVAIGRAIGQRLLPDDCAAVEAAINPMQPGAAWSLWVGNGTAILTTGCCGTRAGTAAAADAPAWTPDDDHSGDDADDIADDYNMPAAGALDSGLAASLGAMELGI